MKYYTDFRRSVVRALLAAHEAGDPVPPAAELARELGADRAQVSRTYSWLEEIGALVRQRAYSVNVLPPEDPP